MEPLLNTVECHWS